MLMRLEDYPFIRAKQEVEILKDFESNLRKHQFYVRLIRNEINATTDSELRNKKARLLLRYGLVETFELE